MRSRACLHNMRRAFGTTKVDPQLEPAFGSPNRLQTGELDARKRAILGQKSARIRGILGLGGYHVTSRVCVSRSEMGLQNLIPTRWQAFGGPKWLQTRQAGPQKGYF